MKVVGSNQVSKEFGSTLAETASRIRIQGFWFSLGSMGAVHFSTEFSTSVENALPERLSSGRGPGIIAFRGGHFKLFFRGKPAFSGSGRKLAPGRRKRCREGRQKAEKRPENGPGSS